MDFSILEIITGFIALFLAIYYYFTSTFNFWSSRGVAGPKPTPFLGNFSDVLFNRLYIGDLVTKFYNEFKNEPMFGIFVRREPVLILNDPELIKTVLIKDFSYFSDRGMKVYEKIEPMSQHLFSLEPERWRPLRVKLSPIFTSGKLKDMFYLMLECADQFEKYLEILNKKSPVIECRELTAKYTTDVIGVCAFGLKTNALTEEDNECRKIGRMIFDVSFLKSIRNKIRDAAPWLYRLLGPLMYQYTMNRFFINLYKETTKFRKENNVRRNDFIDLLMDLKENPDKANDIEMTDALMTAQVFVFFAAGFETSSTTISNALYELALNQSVQDILRKEIKETYEANNGKLTFDSIKSMKYMHKVVCETLRKYPVVTVLMRRSLKKYTFPDTNVTIPKGTKIWIPAYAIQRDPDIYSNPETFDPERFEEENVKQRHLANFLPFGDGPRNCIGARFAHYQVKIGIAVILKNYKIEVCDKTCIPYVQNPRSPLLLKPIGDISLKFVKLE